MASVCAGRDTEDTIALVCDCLSNSNRYCTLEGRCQNASKMVTFVDNLYGTVTEDNAQDYLIDHLHLNVAGRKKVAERFVYALNYFEHMLDSEAPAPN